MLKLLADMMSFLLKAPFTMMGWLNQLIQQRLISEKVVGTVGKELKPLAKVWAVLRFLGILLVWLILLAIFLGIVWGLWLANAALGLERMLGGPLPSLRRYWLPILFLLFCVASFVGYKLYRSLGPDRDLVEFADIDEAWNQARAALVEAGIEFAGAPLFLVLGRPASNAQAFMTASKMPLDVQQIPIKTNPALQVYANKHAIYVLALDACLLGRQAELLNEATQAPEPEADKKARHTVFDEPAKAPESAVPDVSPPDPLLASQNLLAEPAVALLSAPASDSTPWAVVDGKKRMPSLLKRAEEVERYQRRLRYLARRITRDREPFCPLNGVLVLVPFAPMESEDDSSQVATLCQMDLQVLHDTARTRCPLVVLVTDLETSPGYAALNERLDADRRVRLFGQDLPLVPDVKPEQLPLVVSSSLGHFVDALGQWGFRLFRVEESARDDDARLSAANTQLFELMESIRVRAPGLDRLLMRIRCSEPALEFMLGGFYLAATGTTPDQDQAFVPGIFQQLVANQNAVSWTDDALAEEADYQRWTTYGYAALAIFLIAMIMLLYSRWQVMKW